MKYQSVVKNCERLPKTFEWKCKWKSERWLREHSTATYTKRQRIFRRNIKRTDVRSFNTNAPINYHWRTMSLFSTFRPSSFGLVSFLSFSLSFSLSLSLSLCSQKAERKTKGKERHANGLHRANCSCSCSCSCFRFVSFGVENCTYKKFTRKPLSAIDTTTDII